MKIKSEEKVRREDRKRDSWTAQANSFADGRGEKASTCFARKDRWQCLSLPPDFPHPEANTGRIETHAFLNSGSLLGELFEWLLRWKAVILKGKGLKCL